MPAAEAVAGDPRDPVVNTSHIDFSEVAKYNACITTSDSTICSPVHKGTSALNGMVRDDIARILYVYVWISSVC